MILPFMLEPATKHAAADGLLNSRSASSKPLESILSVYFLCRCRILSGLEELQNKLIQHANSREEYDAVVDEIYQLRELKQDTLEHNAERHTKSQRITEMADFLKEHGGEIAEYDDKLVRQLVERVEVLGDKMTVAFKSGLDVETLIY